MDCIECGCNFIPEGKELTCSIYCRKERNRRMQKENYEKNKEEIKAKQILYYYNNLETSRKRNKSYGDANRQKLNEYGKGYRKRNKELFTEDQILHDGEKECRGCHLVLPIKCFAVQKSYRSTGYRDYTCMLCTSSKRAGLLAEGFTIEDWFKRLKQFNHQCAYCKKSNTVLHIEHFYPHSKGGSGHMNNLVPACQPCNNRKRAQDPWIWLRKNFPNHEFLTNGVPLPL